MLIRGLRVLPAGNTHLGDVTLGVVWTKELRNPVAAVFPLRIRNMGPDLREIEPSIRSHRFRKSKAERKLGKA